MARLNKLRNIYLDYLKAIFCIAVLLYHSKLLTGGYLAVSGFFVLSGYLTTISILKNDEFNIKNFYIKRLIRLYVPMEVIVFVSIGVVSLFKDIFWVSLGPETTSILLGYNNFWQIGANMDYFANHSDSPFMHLWYIAILLQLTIVAPLIILPLKKLGKSKGWKTPALVCLAVSIGLMGLFIWFCQSKEMMSAYYNTLSRSFSFFFGIATAFFSLQHSDKPKKNSRYYFLAWIALQIIMFVFVPADSQYYVTAMILATIATCACIVCGNKTDDKAESENCVVDKVATYISDISYELYLVQYPVIFLLQHIASSLDNWIVVIIGIFLSVVCAQALHLFFNTNKKKLALCILIALCCFGCFKYIVAEDHSEEMAQLEALLAKNQEAIQARQADYQKRAQQEEVKWQQQLSEFDASDEDIAKIVKEMSISSIGDSVMLGASTALYKVFPNLYCDAAVSRTGWEAPKIIKDLQAKSMLGDAVVIGLGTNGDCPRSVKEEIMDLCEESEVYWVGVTNDKDVHVNANLKKFADEYDNAHFIDWASASKNHPGYFVSDGIHLESNGSAAYSQFIYDSICEGFKQSIERRKAIAIAEHEDAENNKISMWGDDLLLNLYENINTEYEICDMHFYSAHDKKQPINDFIAARDNDELTHRLVFAFGNEQGGSYSELLDECTDNIVYIVKVCESEDLSTALDYDNVKIVDFTNILSEHSEYWLADRKHLSEAGNIALGQLISDAITIF